MPEMKGAIADNINNRTNKQSNKLSSPAKKTTRKLITDARNRHGHCKIRRHEFINKVVRKAINF